MDVRRRESDSEQEEPEDGVPTDRTPLPCDTCKAPMGAEGRRACPLCSQFLCCKCILPGEHRPCCDAASDAAGHEAARTMEARQPDQPRHAQLAPAPASTDARDSNESATPYPRGPGSAVAKAAAAARAEVEAICEEEAAVRLSRRPAGTPRQKDSMAALPSLERATAEARSKASATARAATTVKREAAKAAAASGTAASSETEGEPHSMALEQPESYQGKGDPLGSEVTQFTSTVPNAEGHPPAPPR